MMTSCEETKVNLYELIDEKKLLYKILPVEQRIGTIQAHQIILEVKLTLSDKKKHLMALAKTDKNKIDKKLKTMPTLEESSDEEPEEDEEEDEDVGRSKS